MEDLTFEYKGRKLFINIYKFPFSQDIIFQLCDVTDLDKEMINFSEKELAKVEILDYIKNDFKKDFEKTIIATKKVSLKHFISKNYNIFLKVKKELLKEFDNEKR